MSQCLSYECSYDSRLETMIYSKVTYISIFQHLFLALEDFFYLLRSYIWTTVMIAVCDFTGQTRGSYSIALYKLTEMDDFTCVYLTKVSK